MATSSTNQEPLHSSRAGRRIAPALLLLCLFAAPSAPADEPATPSRTMPAIGSGELLRKTDQGWEPLPVLDIDVEIEVTGIMARGIVTQRFANPTDELIDTIYVFPLSAGAAVHRMEMRIGDRRIFSEIREKQEARETYEAAKAEGKKAALLDRINGNLFSTSAANINPGETIDVILEFVEQVEWSDGRFRLRFPLTFTPRFSPRSGKTAHRGAPFRTTPGEFTTPEARIAIRLDTGFALRSVESDSHGLEVARGTSGTRVTTRPARILADRDFRLSWQPEPGPQAQTVTFVEDRADGRYALVMVLPPAPESDMGMGLPTETLFVIDVSGSMQGPSIAQAREALLAALDRLRPEDTFDIIRFNDGFFDFRGSFLHAEPDSIEAARRWVRDLRADGGTMIYPALMHGIALLGNSRSTRAQRIVFLTDGAIANEQQLLEAVARDLGGARLHAIGIGNAPNGYLMRKIAQLGRGLCEFIAVGSDTGNEIDRFFARLERPVLTDIELTWDGVESAETYPSRTPDLHAGEPLWLSARLDGDRTPDSVTIEGFDRTGFSRRTVPLRANADAGSGVAMRWAQARVEDLLDSVHDGLDPGIARDEIIETGLAFGLVTPFTSLVAVERIPTAIGGGRSLRASNALPLGGTDDRARLLLGLILAGFGAAFLAWPRLPSS